MPAPLTYKDAGVDIHKAAEFVHDIGKLRMRTEKQRKLFQAFGLFAASYDLSQYKEPVIVTGCDGVGTKVQLLLKHDMLEAAGKDLVAMNVNDVLTSGADPILFLDYLGVGHIDKARLGRLIAGMVDYLEACGCILAGGETAEMPDLVEGEMVEMAGFCIGVAEKPQLIDPSRLAVGDVLIGFPSDGFHANGFSLVRKVLAHAAKEFSNEEIRALLAPTRLYHEEVNAIRAAGVKPKALGHITGGGLPENLGRMLNGKGFKIKLTAWENDPVRKVLRHVEKEDAFQTFNMGVGWVAAVGEEDVGRILEIGRGGHVIGEIGGGKLHVEVAEYP